jgi:hypothetical protein
MSCTGLRLAADVLPELAVREENQPRTTGTRKPPPISSVSLRRAGSTAAPRSRPTSSKCTHQRSVAPCAGFYEVGDAKGIITCREDEEGIVSHTIVRGKNRASFPVAHPELSGLPVSHADRQRNPDQARCDLDDDLFVTTTDDQFLRTSVRFLLAAAIIETCVIGDTVPVVTQKHIVGLEAESFGLRALEDLCNENFHFQLPASRVEIGFCDLPASVIVCLDLHLMTIGVRLLLKEQRLPQPVAGIVVLNLCARE